MLLQKFNKDMTNIIYLNIWILWHLLCNSLKESLVSLGNNKQLLFVTSFYTLRYSQRLFKYLSKKIDTQTHKSK